MVYERIKSKKRYNEYCDRLAKLVFAEVKTRETQLEIDLLTLLIEKYNSIEEVDPITLLRLLLEEGNLTQKDLTEILGVSKGLVSDIMNYKKHLSRRNAQILALHFKLDRSTFRKPYELKRAKL